MDDFYRDIYRYPKVWQAILENVLRFSRSQSDQWMNEQGKELLTDPGITLHEEPWYWLCPLIVNEFASTAKDIDFRRSENQVFFVLARSLTGSEEKEIDWETVRRECKAAIVRIGAENEAPPTAQD